MSNLLGSLQFFPGIWWLKLRNGNWTRPKYPVLAPSLAKATPVVMAIPQILLEDNKCAPARAGTVTLYDFRKAGAYFKFLFYRPFRMLHRLTNYKDHFLLQRDPEYVYFKISLTLCIINNFFASWKTVIFAIKLTAWGFQWHAVSFIANILVFQLAKKL